MQALAFLTMGWGRVSSRPAAPVGAIPSPGALPRLAFLAIHGHQATWASCPSDLSRKGRGDL